MNRSIPPLVIAALMIISLPAAAKLTQGNTERAAQIRDSLMRMDMDRYLNAESEPENWLLHGRTYAEQRYSPLDQINTETVKDLGLVWSYDTGTKRGHETSPIVVDGVMYGTANWGKVFALDAKTGELIWENDLNVDKTRGLYACCDVVNRGAAVWKGKVYVATTDGRLVALDAVSGEIIWDVLTIDLARPYTITGAPRIIKGNVIIGNGGAEYGVRGYVTAYDAETGEKVWRFYTVPGNPADGFESPTMKMAAESWGGGPWWEIGGGGTAWNSMAYDPELDQLYIGVGNGSPWNAYIRSPAGGDNLFLSSIVAVDPDTGEYIWHYQTTPGERWDYTAVEHMILADIEIDGKTRKVLMQAPKNGFFYVLDRETGEFISAENFVTVSWATHIDPKTGRPVMTENEYDERPVIQFPSPLGGHNWMPMCRHPNTGYVYIPSQEMPMLYDHDPDFEYLPGYWNVGVGAMKDIMVPPWLDLGAITKLGGAAAEGFLQAWDPVKQEQVWKVEHNGFWNGSMLCLADNMVMQGTGDGRLVAYTADTGKKLWEYRVAQGVLAPPVTYMVDGEQYIAVEAGWGGAVGLAFSPIGNPPEKIYKTGRMLAFKLGGKAELEPPNIERKVPEPPPIDDVPASVMATGNKAYHKQCVYCHGPAAVGHPNLDDLRYMDAETHEQFAAIVLGGQPERGMPAFAGKLTSEEVEAIHAYLAKLGHQIKAQQEQSSWWIGLKNLVYTVIAFVTGIFIEVFRWFMDAAD